ncbi:MAG TPA: hypothetical protein VFB25_05560 [Gaiellaceae bacterium]|nr:hypothetical protein [Gaiellaceae bacterium]
MSVDGRLTLVRFDGARAVVDGCDAHAIVAALWELGLLAGAATAAASMAGAINAPPSLRKPVQFTERESEAVRRASDGHATWSPV